MGWRWSQVRTRSTPLSSSDKNARSQIDSPMYVGTVLSMCVGRCGLFQVYDVEVTKWWRVVFSFVSGRPGEF